jgi:hypothetical protein
MAGRSLRYGILDCFKYRRIWTRDGNFVIFGQLNAATEMIRQRQGRGRDSMLPGHCHHAPQGVVYYLVLAKESPWFHLCSIVSLQTFHQFPKRGWHSLTCDGPCGENRCAHLLCVKLFHFQFCSGDKRITWWEMYFTTPVNLFDTPLRPFVVTVVTQDTFEFVCTFWDHSRAKELGSLWHHNKNSNVYLAVTLTMNFFLRPRSWENKRPDSASGIFQRM